MGVSLAEYIRRLLARDLSSPRASGNPAAVFDLGATAVPTCQEQARHGRGSSGVAAR